MTEAFYSPTNMYSLDPEDAEVILTGYSEQEAKPKNGANVGHYAENVKFYAIIVLQANTILPYTMAGLELCLYAPL